MVRRRCGLGEGTALALSPSGNLAASTHLGDQQPLVLLPTGAGEPKLLLPQESRMPRRFGSPTESALHSWGTK